MIISFIKDNLTVKKNERGQDIAMILAEEKKLYIYGSNNY